MLATQSLLITKLVRDRQYLGMTPEDAAQVGSLLSTRERNPGRTDELAFTNSLKAN